MTMNKINQEYVSIDKQYNTLNKYISIGNAMNKFGEEYFIQQIDKIIELIDKIIGILIQ